MAFGSSGSGGSTSQQTYQNTYLDPKMVKGLATTLGGVQQQAASLHGKRLRRQR